MKKATIIIITILFLSNPGNSQTAEEFSLLKEKAVNISPEPYYKEFSKGNTNELQFAFSSFFLLYKEFISSQDGSSCGFSPSCSEYGILAIKKRGILPGMLGTFDRLSRCHGLAPEYYRKHPENGLLIDHP